MIVVLNTSLPSVPNEMVALKTASGGMTQEWALDVANRVFDVSDNFKDLGNVWKIWSGSREAWVYKSGGIEYLDTYKTFEKIYRQDELPSDIECREIAELFLGNIGGEGLLQTNLDMEFRDVVRDKMVIAHADGTIENCFTNAHVNYDLSFNGTKLYGPGAKLRVYIGSGGEITGLMKYLPQIEELETVQTLTPEEAIEVFRGGDYGASEATIQSFKLVYYVPSPEAETTYIIPVYNLSGTFTLPNGDVVGFGKIIPAVSQSELENMGLPTELG
jgi:hypothetical protein